MIKFIVAGPEYWESIPQTRELFCRRVRITSSRCEPPKGADVYVHADRHDAVRAAITSQHALIQETERTDGEFYYQLLIGSKS